ncbi:MAG: DUF3857 domain-containing protein [Bacteroidota bacterium]
MKSFFLTILLAISSILLSANTIPQIWETFEKGDYVLARKLLNEATKKKATQVEASMILMLLNMAEMEDGAVNMRIAKNIFPQIENPNPYLFPFWYDDAILDGQSKKSREREEFLLNLLANGNLHPSVKGSLRYMIGFHYGLSNRFEESKAIWDPIKGIKDWQLVGPFDNTSGSGFNKNYAPIQEANPATTFQSTNNAPIRWFVPELTDDQPWVATEYYVPSNNAVVYGQTFFELEASKELVFATGFTGNIKIWINEQLIISEEEELRTDMDYLRAKVRVPTGKNRILVQLGYTSKSDYPNYMVRVFDENNEVIDLNCSSEYVPYNQSGTTLSQEKFPHFAEQFFQQKIKTSPKNILNHLLLAKTYYRSNRFNDAIKVLEQANELYPNNLLTNLELLYNFTSIDDRTKISTQIERLRKIDGDACFFALFDYEIHSESEDLDKLKQSVDKMRDCLGEDNEDYLAYYTNWLTRKKDFQKLLEVAQFAFEKYPENQTFLTYKFNILNNVQQKPEEAVALLEDFLTKNYNYDVYHLLKNEYVKRKENKKVEAILLKLHELYPNHIQSITNNSSYYYKIGDFDTALKFTNIGLQNAPYRASYWSDRSYIHQALNQKEAAIADLEKSITYNPNNFQDRERLRTLRGQSSVKELFKDKDRAAQIQQQLTKEVGTEADYTYLFYDKAVVVYEEGPYSEYFSMAWQIQNEAGINQWKEANIEYDSGSERLIFERAEVFKKNGEKVIAERSDNEFVFTSLEIGDIIFVEYRLDSYQYGQLAQEFWQTCTFDDFVPIMESRYRLLFPKDKAIYFKYSNFEHTPIKTEMDNFLLYDWTLTDVPLLKEENYMPTITEIGKTLSISTLDSWSDIANWYRDLSLPQAREDYNLQAIYEEIFPKGKATKMSETEKAEAIYSYILDNIQYSYVSFRQSGYVPQKPMVTISTRLGDCKDVSTLYHTLAQKAGLKTNLVLVNTRDNGEETILQPSIDFNHCIIKIDLPEATLFQELTDNNLPFGAIPNSIQRAQALVIPNLREEVPSELLNIPTRSVLKNTLQRQTALKVVDANLEVQTQLEVLGKPASSYRSYFADLTEEKQREKVGNLVGGYFDGDLDKLTYKFDNLTNIEKGFTFESDFVATKAVLSIGGIKAVKIPYMEVIFTADDFPQEARKSPLLYWRYESYDAYENEIELVLPEGVKIMEMPTNKSIKNDYLDYQLTFEKTDEQTLKIRRTVQLNRIAIPAAEYEQFRAVVQEILEVEDAYVAYK